jgi:PKD repeat protein
VVQSSPLPSPQVATGDGEWDLDSQTSTGIAGQVKQLVFYNGTDLGDSLLNGYHDFATQKRAKAGNMSYGGCEVLQHATDPTGDPLGLALFADFVSAADQLFMQAVAQGQTWFASAGDAGAACSLVVNIVTPDFGVPSQVEYPASSPYVVGVGGTSLVTDSDFNYITEVAWDAGGGGFSLNEKAPAWQGAVVPTAGAPAIGGRGVPDIAMVAGGPDVGTPVGFFGFGGADIVSNGGHGAAVGTSWSSPLAVGVWARLQSTRCNSMGFAAPLLYALDPSPGIGTSANGFNDIVVGNNGQYNATPGWDYTTGYGTFDITKVNSAMSAIAPIPAGCTATVAAPVAALSASPLPVAFDASQSMDPANLALSDYSMDFGDGTTVNQTGAVFAPHVYATPGTYTAVLHVTNAGGGTSNAVSKTITAFGTPQACATGGQVMLTSAPGAADALQGQDLGNGTDDLRSTAISEPGSLSNKLVFTTTVANLSTVQPGFRWVTYFDVVGRKNPNAEYYYVAMTSSNGPAPVFEYGIHSYAPGPEPLTLYTPMGSLDAGSNYTKDGVITLVLDKAAFNLKPSDVLTDIFTSTRLTTPTDATGTAPGGAGLTQDSAGAALPYIVVGNEICAPNVAPDAKLAATPAAPIVGQAVSLDASGSHDPDSQDTVKYFSFDFGDGSSSGWQTGATLNHTYAAVGNFTPTVRVADSRGKTSSNLGTVTVAVAAATPPPPPPATSGLIAQLAADAVSGGVPLVVRLDASGSKNTDGTAIKSPKFTFVFGDGTPPSQPQASPVFVHSYTAAGTFKPYVIVTDANNQSAVSPQLSITSTVLITVTGAASETVAQLTVDNASGPAPLTVTFDGSRSFPADGAHITSYAFDFGDNTAPVVGTSPTAQHVYTVPGSYEPRLTVTDSRMATSVAKAAVLIQDAGTPGTGTPGASGSPQSGGGALGLMTLLPLLGFGVARKRKK